MLSAGTIAIVTYETPFTPWGGISQVIRRLPGPLSLSTGRPVSVIAPLHHRMAPGTPEAAELWSAVLSGARAPDRVLGVPMAESSSGVMEVEAHCYPGDQPAREGWPLILLRARDERYFAGQRHPYDVSDERLLRDALLFGASVAELARGGEQAASWTLLLQDWEAATAALALAAARFEQRPRASLTLHNSYDSGPLPDSLLAELGIDPTRCPGAPSATGAADGGRVTTVLRRALPLVEQPVFTVSEQFARDLVSDTLQTSVMADHLQELLGRPGGLVGIDNGRFESLAIDDGPLTLSVPRRSAGFLNWKSRQRDTLLAIWRRLDASDPERPVWGDLAAFAAYRERLREERGFELPWFIMSGRDDPNQKGFDVAVSALRPLLRQGFEAQALFCPLPQESSLAELGFLEALAREFPDRVVALPFRLQAGQGYLEAFQGATYGLMPSMYEPFGMANELYLKGVVGIGRATGGILGQIVPLGLDGSHWCSPAVRERALGLYDAETPATGLLYREPNGIASAEQDWRAINARGYLEPNAGLDRVAEREQYALYRWMSRELGQAMLRAAQLYRQTPRRYCELLEAGIERINGEHFAWERAAGEYAARLGCLPE